MVVGGEHRGRMEAKVWLFHSFFRSSGGYLPIWDRTFFFSCLFLLLY